MADNAKKMYGASYTHMLAQATRTLAVDEAGNYVGPGASGGSPLSETIRSNSSATGDSATIINLDGQGEVIYLVTGTGSLTVKGQYADDPNWYTLDVYALPGYDDVPNQTITQTGRYLVITTGIAKLRDTLASGGPVTTKVRR